MKKKIFWAVTFLLIVFTLSGCMPEKEDERETINPLSPGSMVETLDRSKGKIDKAVEEQNVQIERALEESGLAE